MFRQLGFYYSYRFLKRNILALIRMKDMSGRNTQTSQGFIIYTIDFNRQIHRVRHGLSTLSRIEQH